MYAIDFHFNQNNVQWYVANMIYQESWWKKGSALYIRAFCGPLYLFSEQRTRIFILPRTLKMTRPLMPTLL